MSLGILLILELEDNFGGVQQIPLLSQALTRAAMPNLCVIHAHAAVHGRRVLQSAVLFFVVFI